MSGYEHACAAIGHCQIVDSADSARKPGRIFAVAASELAAGLFFATQKLSRQFKVSAPTEHHFDFNGTSGGIVGGGAHLNNPP
jgi:hypothetical protein